MFYRQKILLAMTEANGNRIGSTDLQKLLFLYCQETNQNHYDFFPYQYGAFSFTSYDDKRKLVNQGYLKDVDSFELNTNTSFLSQLKPKDRASMQAFAMTTRNLRGSKLIQKAYLEYPEYVIKSAIIDKVLSSAEKKRVQQSWVQETTPMAFTIGYEGSTIDDYIRRLIFNNVQILIDVRRNPLSRKHGFSKNKLQNYLARAGIQYCHIPELGIDSHLRKDLSSKESYSNLFALYSKTVLPNQTIALNKILQMIAKYNRVALTCFEADPCMCHRHKIIEELQTNMRLNIPVAHI